MQRRRLGQLEVSAVGLGCGTMTPFYGEPNRAAGIATIRRAREIGVDLLDTADGYGRGRNEELVAEAVREHRGGYVIASKFGNLGLLGDPRFADGRPEYVREACEKSLGRLKTDVIDLYYIHRVDPTVPIEDTIGAMASLSAKASYAFSAYARPGRRPSGGRMRYIRSPPCRLNIPCGRATWSAKSCRFVRRSASALSPTVRWAAAF